LPSIAGPDEIRSAIRGAHAQQYQASSGQIMHTTVAHPLIVSGPTPAHELTSDEDGNDCQPLNTHTQHSDRQKAAPDHHVPWR
jgi:hypothetical protein